MRKKRNEKRRNQAYKTKRKRNIGQRATADQTHTGFFQSVSMEVEPGPPGEHDEPSQVPPEVPNRLKPARPEVQNRFLAQCTWWNRCRVECKFVSSLCLCVCVCVGALREERVFSRHVCTRAHAYTHADGRSRSLSSDFPRQV